MKKNFILYRRHVTAALLVLFFAMGILAAVRAGKGSNDYDTFYETGRAVLKGEGIYYTGEYFEQDFEHGPFLYPPMAAVFFAGFAWMPLWLAAFIWNAFNVFLFASCALLILHTFGITAARLGEKWREARFFDRCASVLLFFVLLMDNLAMAQANILVLWICLAGVNLIERRDRPVPGGIALALAATIKMTPALFFIYYLVRQKGRVLAGMLAGLILFAGIIPAVAFGIEGSRIYHQQWAGKMLKPRMIGLWQVFKPEEPHFRKPGYEKLQNQALADLLTQQNQSLEAGLTRLFLHNRSVYGLHPSFPFYVAGEYEKMPVFIGVPREVLAKLIKALEFLMLLILIFAWRHDRKSTCLIPVSIALVFLSMTLFSPSARSHQMIAWIWPLAVLIMRNFDLSTVWRNALWRLAAVFYLLQALPYGKAAGAGMWANLLLWLFFLILSFQSRPIKKPAQTFIAI